MAFQVEVEMNGNTAEAVNSVKFLISYFREFVGVRKVKVNDVLRRL